MFGQGHLASLQKISHQVRKRPIYCNNLSLACSRCCEQHSDRASRQWYYPNHPPSSIIPKPVFVPVLRYLSPINLPGKLYSCIESCIVFFIVFLQESLYSCIDNLIWQGGPVVARSFFPIILLACLKYQFQERVYMVEGVLTEHLGLLSGVHEGDVHTSKPCKQE